MMIKIGQQQLCLVVVFPFVDCKYVWVFLYLAIYASENPSMEEEERVLNASSTPVFVFAETSK
jgi:hypothetical protein